MRHRSGPGTGTTDGGDANIGGYSFREDCASGIHVKEADYVSGKDVEHQGQGGLCSGVCIGEVG